MNWFPTMMPRQEGYESTSSIPYRKPTALDGVYLVMTFLGGGAACVFVSRSADAPEGVPLVLYFLSVAVACGLSVAEILTERPRSYLTFLGFHASCCLLAAALAGPFLPVLACLGLPTTLGICVHSPFPLSILFGAVLNGLLTAVYALYPRAAALPYTNVLLVGYATAVAMLMPLTVLAVSYRERLIDSQEEGRRLDGLVERLTRTNLNYQEYAKTVEEASIDSERKRITRDIHDVVGYTLTNNIMMMEEITDLMRTNPLGVYSLVNSARVNAEEGLARVRTALHTLRGVEVRLPKGLPAVQKLVLVFQHATGVKVEFAFSDVSWDFDDAADSALYHVIQEGLMNSFQHGKASLVRIFLSRDAGRVVLQLRDDGIGAQGLMEGIGLSGMRERLAQAGGTLQAAPVPGGFEVRASIPAERIVGHA